MIMYLLYQTVVLNSVSVLTCSPDMGGKRYIVADYRQECGTAEHQAHVALAITMLLGFAVTFPIAAWYVLFKRRHKLHTDERTMRRFLFLYQVSIGLARCA